MSRVFSWTCPYCQKATTITEQNYSENVHFFDKSNKDGLLGLWSYVVTCPNPDCKEYQVGVVLYKAHTNTPSHMPAIDAEKPLLRFQIRPESVAKQFPDYVPLQIRSDYTEACRIRDLSPKASATLSRRCLQGILRDFWQVNRPNLKQEIEAVKDKVDSLTWDAIDSVRQIGNIGAHMEKDINLIIDIDPNEAELLLGLIETLIQDWYVERHQKQQRLLSIKKIADSKRPDNGKDSTTDSPS